MTLEYLETAFASDNRLCAFKQNKCMFFYLKVPFKSQFVKARYSFFVACTTLINSSILETNLAPI